MPDEDLQHLICNKRVPSTRKRNIVNGYSNAENIKIWVPIPELDFNDPDFLKLLKEYEDDSDSNNERKQFEAQRGSRKPNGSTLNNGLGYTILTGIVLVFIIIINWFNSKELERLKEEFGFEDRHLYSEQWWKRGFFYVLHVPTFADSNNDQIGDIEGIRGRVNDFEYLGIDAIILTCLVETYQSNDLYPNCGSTTNFTSINPIFGNLDDLRRLFHNLSEKGIKVIIQIDPNHTHENHRWFMKSRKNSVNNKFKNYYVWNKGKTLTNGSRQPPNNWLNTDGNPAWSLYHINDNFYYHAYDKTLPDLNHRHQDVRNEFLKIFEFWLEKGADGILLTSVEKLLEVEDAYLNEPNNEFQSNLTGYERLQHVYTLDQQEVHDYISSWRQFFEEYFIKRQKHFCLLVEVGSHPTTDVVRYYHTGADLAVSCPFVGASDHCGGECVNEILEGWMNRVGEDALWMRYELLDHRSVKTNMRDAFNMLLMLLPGSAMLHQQDFLSSNQNMETEKLVELVHRMSRLRRDRSFLIGQLKFIHIDQNMLTFVRFANTEKKLSKAYRKAENQPMKDGRLGEVNDREASRKALTRADDLRMHDDEVGEIDEIDREPKPLNAKVGNKKFERKVGKKEFKIKQLDSKNNDDKRLDINDVDALFSSSVPYVVAINFGTRRSTVDLATTLGSTKGRIILTRLNAENEGRLVEGGMVDLIHFTLQSGEAIVFIPMLEDEE